MIRLNVCQRPFHYGLKLFYSDCIGFEVLSAVTSIKTLGVVLQLFYLEHRPIVLIVYDECARELIEPTAAEFFIGSLLFPFALNNFVA